LRLDLKPSIRTTKLGPKRDQKKGFAWDQMPNFEAAEAKNTN